MHGQQNIKVVMQLSNHIEMYTHTCARFMCDKSVVFGTATQCTRKVEAS